MDSQLKFDKEIFLPSSLLDDVDYSDNDSNTSINFNQKFALFNEEEKNEKSLIQVNHYKFIINYFLYNL